MQLKGNSSNAFEISEAHLVLPRALGTLLRALSEGRVT